MRWTLKKTPDSTKVQHLQQELNVEPIIATLLVQRGIETFEAAKSFFRPTLADLHDPFLMKDMEKAVTRIEKAIFNNENILVFGDYDVDGTTAVALVASFLKSYYPNVATYIPDRYDEGYGISYKGIDYAEDNAISLIIALDCGIKSIDHVTYANTKSIDFIICDHHLPGEEVPKAVAVLDPKRSDCKYPYDELCGCGIGFKLIQALGSNLNYSVDSYIPYLDLVATAIAADIVPITGENRVLTKIGLEVINSNPRAGIKALIQNSKKNKFTITDVVFYIAPRINAAGRIKHGNEAVALLTEYNINQAEIYASEIENHNTNRKDLDKQITIEALLEIELKKEQNNFTTVVYNEKWHKGVIGIVASRLTETYYRPTLVFTKSGDKLAGSARSVKEFDVYKAIEECASYLDQFGGHKYAAGMTLKEENYEAFKIAFEKVVKTTINPDLLIPEITIDLEINFTDISPKLIRLLNQFEPFGPGNMTPVFKSNSVCDTGHGRLLGKEEEHLKLFIKQNDSEGIPAIGFGVGKKIALTTHKKNIDIVYCIDESEYNGLYSIQLRLKDLSASLKNEI